MEIIADKLEIRRELCREKKDLIIQSCFSRSGSFHLVLNGWLKLLATDPVKLKEERNGDFESDPFLSIIDDRISIIKNAIISKMQHFLLELGKGFLFEARQKRFTFDEDDFFVDLVFYNRLLQCYVLIDLKVGKLTHQDLGQMQMYVNYYDRYVKQDFEKPTVGILLCKEKKDALVELTLPKDSNIYAQQYALYLPDKKLLQNKLQEWLEEQEE